MRLLGTHKHQMTAVVGEVARIWWLILLINLPIGFELFREREMRAAPEYGAELLFLDQIMKGDSHIGTGLRQRELAVGRLSVVEHPARHGDGGARRLLGAVAKFLPGRLIFRHVSLFALRPG